ncbi:Golgin subfamily A member 4 [Araneus ventricosus]|uniref:Golgin subfamily A member 4 n=1 Tax=Araneus ventricosus TaxID=182803 RepID=A0A4Y2N9K0_ARAVE|nr:Golgin subfamily A member 4 [Araneus ventricosus]
MFKRLRERIAEEATKFPVGQLNTNTGKQSDAENKTAGGNSTEDLITLSDSSSVVVPHTSSQQFSIGEDEDGSVSEQSTPKKKSDSANGATNEHSVYSSSSRDHPAGTGSDLGFGQEYRPTKSSYIPQSDIESEREDPPTLNLEGISKDQLLSIIELLKARAYKYKNKYVEVVKNYKELREEKLKIENTLIEQQDKALRRMAELREQCQLEQKAKAHLEANLRLMLEEKDSRITVLETQINLLKESANSTIMEASDKQNSESSGTLIDISAATISDDSSLRDKMERFEHQLNQANKTITAQTDQISLLRKQNESLSQELEEKVKKLNDMEDEQGQLKSKHEFILQGLQGRLKELEDQQEENMMSMAETKKNMHEELEFKEKQLVKAEEEAKQCQAAYEAEKLKVLDLQKQHEEKVNSLQRQLESTERMLEEEKQNLMQELARGKSAAITLVQQECAKKIAAVEEECKIKLQDLQKEKNETSGKKVNVIEEELKQKKQHVEELNSIIEQLEKENSSLKNSLEKLQSDLDTSSTNLDTLRADYLDLKESSDKKLVQIKEQLNQELNEKLHVYQKTESGLRSLCDSLRDQLSEKQNMLNDLLNSKSSLCHQVEVLEKREKDLINETESLKQEVNELQMKCQSLASELESFSEHNSQEIQQLQEHLAQTESNNQNAIKELTECKAEILKLNSENKALFGEVNFLNTNSNEIKSKLCVAEEKVAYLNDILDESSREFEILKTILDEKLNLVGNRMEDFRSIESSLASLEEENRCLKSEISKHEIVCNELVQKVKKLSKAMKLAIRHKQIVDTDINSVEKKDINSELLNENNFIQRKEGLMSDTNTNEPELSGNHRNDDFLLPLEKYDLTSCNRQELKKICTQLMEENQKLKGELEAQNVEFAKNITQLHGSLAELQEERNNLSLVLQSIETQSQEMSPSPERSTKATENDREEGFNVIKQNKERDNKLDIMELNDKVRFEIAALSAQTEMINHELQSKHDSVQSENEKLKSSLLESENELKTLKEEYVEVNCSLDKTTNELNDAKNRVSLLEELHNKYDSLAKDYECVCQNLEREKISASEALKTASEWKSLYDSVLCNLNDFSSKSFENMKAITVGLNQNEMKLQSFEQQFLKVTALCQSQKSQICILKDEIVNLKEVNKNLCEKIPNENHLLDMESKLETLDQMVKEVIEEKENLKSELESELETTKLDLKTALSEIESNKIDFSMTQSKLVDTLSKLEDAEKKLKEESEKLSVSKIAIVEWEKKYDTTIHELKKTSDSLKKAEESMKSSLKQIEEKNAQISVMISKEKFESYEQNYSNKFEKMKSEIEELKAEVIILSTNVKDKELEIQQIQSGKENMATQHDESLKCLKEKLENAEKNYIIQIDELKSQILQLEEEKCTLKTDKSELLKSQEKLQNEESAIKSDLRLKEDELLKLQQKYETTNKEQVAKLHNFQETMKDKENMILKLKANIESIKKENLEKTEELKRKISKLEEEREQLMIQAQERVSITEAKCREDIKVLQEKNNNEIEKLNKKISQIDKELSECNRIAESKEVAARKEISLLKDQLAKAEEKLCESEKKKKETEAELTGKVRKLEEENSSLLGKTNHFESLKAEKEELNEKLKQAEQQVTSIKMLENEKDELKNENMAILKELEILKSSQSDDELKQKVEALEENEKSLLKELEELKESKEALESELTELKTSFEKERENLKSQNEKLQKQISLLEKMSSDPQSTASKDYIAVIRGDCETAIKAKEEEMETKLKHLVRDFCIQMDVKDKDCDKMLSELLEKNQDLEERLGREHRKEVSELRQNLFEKECALDEMRDNYEEQLQEKEKKLKELQCTIKRLSESSHSVSNDVAPISIEGSDWDDTWAVPEEVNIR